MKVKIDIWVENNVAIGDFSRELRKDIAEFEGDIKMIKNHPYDDCFHIEVWVEFPTYDLACLLWDAVEFRSNTENFEVTFETLKKFPKRFEVVKKFTSDLNPKITTKSA